MRQWQVGPWLVVAVLVLAGCATVDAPKPEKKGPTAVDLAEKRDADLKRFANWVIHGRLGVRLPDDGFSAEFTWEQKVDLYKVAVIDPLGRQVAELKGDFDNTRLKLNDGRVLVATDPDALMQANLGWSLPVKSLIYWVRGLPDPHKVAWRREYDDNGRLKLLEQEGWLVTFSRYIESETSEQKFPALIRLSYKDFKIKLLIQEWR
ncbi:MAG: lipoprotein insertase outer membrane protein LolB [bacterium]